MASRLVADVEKAVTFIEGPMPLDNLPQCLKGAGEKQKILVLAITSTFGKGGPPSSARSFLHKMQGVVAGPIAQVAYAVFALGNSAYNQSFAKFGYAVHDSLQQAGFCPVLDVQVGDELMDQAGAFESWTRRVVRDELLDETRSWRHERCTGSSPQGRAEGKIIIPRLCSSDLGPNQQRA